MSKIRSENTKAEKTVFRELRKKGVYFQKYYKKVAGNPDIALPRKKKAVFIDGDFWHGYQIATLKKRLPKKYWLPKIEKNVRRDIKNSSELKKKGWKVLRIWEHEISRNFEGTTSKIVDFLQKD